MTSARALILTTGAALAAILPPGNLHSDRTGTVIFVQQGTGSPVYAIGGITELCAEEERKAESSCTAFCGEGSVQAFDPGICGIGAKCTCVILVELPPDF